MPATESKCVINISEDKRRKAEVQQTYKVTRVHGCMGIGYTLNLYPTRNSLLLNGKDTDTFIDSHLPAIHELMCQTVQDWKVSSAANLNHILSEQFRHILDQRQPKGPDHPSSCISEASAPTEGTSYAANNRDNFKTSNKAERQASPSSPCDKQEDTRCLKCKRNCIGRSAFCETGAHWIHYYCDRLSKDEEYRLHNDQ